MNKLPVRVMRGSVAACVATIAWLALYAHPASPSPRLTPTTVTLPCVDVTVYVTQPPPSFRVCP